jgi:hypothetical protein
MNEFKTLEVDLKEKLRRSVDYKQIFYYNTSIYDLNSIISAMSEILLNLYPKAELISKTINEFAKKVDSDGVVVIDDNSLIIGSFYKDEETKNLLSASTPYFLTLNDSFQFTQVIPGRIQEEGSMLVQRFGRNFIFKKLNIRGVTTPYYLLMLKGDPNIEKEDFDSFANIMTEILFK